MSEKILISSRRQSDAAGAHYRLQLFHGRLGHDVRKTYWEAEANAIGTEYLRADLLPVESVAASPSASLRDFFLLVLLFLFVIFGD